MNYPWYEVLPEGSLDLQQGDLIIDCPIIIPPPELKPDLSAEIEVQQIDAIILSQSCDLVQQKISLVLVCPYYSLTQFLSSRPPSDQEGKGLTKLKQTLKSGGLPAYHLLNSGETDTEITDFQIVDFKNVHSIHINSLRTLVEKMKKRVRLLPPYREHLSQAFARYFMRVGLPQDLKL